MSNIEKIILVPEILGTATAFAKDDALVSEIKQDLNGFVERRLGLKFESTELSAVENDENEVHLCLPYYSHISDLSTGLMDDEAMAGVIGGISRQEKEANNNWHQAWNNARLFFMGRFDEINNDYAGTFNVETDSSSK